MDLNEFDQSLISALDDEVYRVARRSFYLKIHELRSK